jgi:rhomboid protease GluP
MTGSFSGQEPGAPLTTRPPEPVPTTQTVRVALPPLVPIATYIILGFTVLIYLLQMASMAVLNDDLPLMLGARINSAIREGEIWRFITPAFLHLSPTHIFFNMYALLSVGSFLERHFGHGRFIALYFLGAFTGNVFSFLLTGENSLSAGASTALFGLIAAEGIFFYQNKKIFGSQARKALGNTAFIIIINLFIGLSLGFDNWGHLGGFLGGAMFAWFAGPRWEVAGISPDLHLEDQRESHEIILGAGVVMIIFSALAVWGIFFK